MTSLNDPAIDPSTALRVARTRAFQRAAALAATRPHLAPLTPVPRTPGTPLRVVYLPALVSPGGGARVLLEHVNRLSEAGCDVTVVSRWAKPDWMQLRGRYVQIPWAVDFRQALPECDVIVAGYWDQVLDARAAGVAPVVYYEQGDFHLYDDVPDDVRPVVQANLDAADVVLAVSSNAARALHERYGITAELLPAGIDTDVFPAKAPVAGLDVRAFRVLAVGAAEFKRVPDVIEALSALRSKGVDVELTWAAQRLPGGDLPDWVGVEITPAQARLAELYRQADVYVCASAYESYALPPLEAMASRTTVISSRNGGTSDYGIEEGNLLGYDVGDVRALACALDRVLHDRNLRERLTEEGLVTVEERTWPTVIEALQGLLSDVASRRPQPRSAGAESSWREDLDGIFFDDEDARELLRARARTTDAAVIRVPVAFAAASGHWVRRWRPVLRRRPGGPVLDLWLPATSLAQPTDWTLQAAVSDLPGRPQAAVAQLSDRAKAAGTDTAKLAAVRWLTVALLASQEHAAALQVSRSLTAADPANADHAVLHATAAHAAGALTVPALQNAYGVAGLLGEAADTDAWFVCPQVLVARVGQQF